MTIRDTMIARAHELGVDGDIGNWTNAQLLDAISEKLPPGYVKEAVARMRANS